jgi:ankyrin repeat protein
MVQVSAEHRTPLFEAVEAGHERMVSCLLDLECDINARDGDGCTALYVALDEEEDEIAELLLRKGADPDVGNKDIGEDQTLLAWAASRRKINHVKLLLRHGTNPNLPGKSGMYPLHMAARIGAMNVIATLLSERADPTLKDQSGCTPRMIAEKNKKAVQAGCVELLEKAETSRA